MTLMRRNLNSTQEKVVAVMVVVATAAVVTAVVVTVVVVVPIIMVAVTEVAVVVVPKKYQLVYLCGLVLLHYYYSTFNEKNIK